jgi:hypothetical protein
MWLSSTPCGSSCIRGTWGYETLSHVVISMSIKVLLMKSNLLSSLDFIFIIWFRFGCSVSISSSIIIRSWRFGVRLRLTGPLWNNLSWWWFSKRRSFWSFLASSSSHGSSLWLFLSFSVSRSSSLNLRTSTLWFIKIFIIGSTIRFTSVVAFGFGFRFRFTLLTHGVSFLLS